MSQETPTDGGPVDLPQELREQIREFARALPEMDYYDMLGVERDDEPAAIRDAFFERSKLYHPDRYFNKQLGVYAELLHEIYKRVVVAHDVLRDPKLKATYDKSLGPAPPRRMPKPGAPEPPAKPPGRSLRDRATSRVAHRPLDGLRHRLESGKKKALGVYQEALDARSGGDFSKAANRARLAVAYDPRCKDYVDLLADLLPKENAVRVTEFRRKGRQLLQRGELEAALEVLTEAAQLAPTDAGLASQISELLEKSGVVPTAIDYARRAVELEEENVAYIKQLAALYKRDGQVEAARKQLQRAWELDPMDNEVKAELAATGR